MSLPPFRMPAITVDELHALQLQQLRDTLHRVDEHAQR